jgi:hypothetical protein
VNENSVTPESIARAHADMLAERRRIEADLPGLQITDDGTFLRPAPRLVGMACFKPGCWFVAMRSTAEEAQRAVEDHYTLRHAVTRVQERAS